MVKSDRLVPRSQLEIDTWEREGLRIFLLVRSAEQQSVIVIIIVNNSSDFS